MAGISRTELLRIPAALKGLGYTVIAPVRSGRTCRLAPISEPEEVETGCLRVTNSPKDFLLPNGEILYRYQSTAVITSYGLKIRFPTVEDPSPAALAPECALPKEKLAFFGLRACLTCSLKYLDGVMLSDPPDPYYRARREGAFIAVLECEEGDEYCFCGAVGSDRVPDGYADLIIRGDGGGFQVRAMTARGERLLSDGGIPEARNLPDRAPKMKYEYALDVRADIDSMDVSGHVETCTLCGGCTVTCPTCYCFDIVDKFTLLNPSDVERRRVCMSCQRKYYSMIAGGTTFVRTKEERFKWRLRHKFPQQGAGTGPGSPAGRTLTVGCVGCGKCIATCPSRIDFRGLMQETCNDTRR